MKTPETPLHLDFETRSVVDLNKCGVEKYAEHPLTDVLCASYALENGEVRSTVRGDFESCDYWQSIVEHIASRGVVYAHNARFEYYLFNMLAARNGWPRLHPSQMRCTMAMARALSLPGALGQLAQALKLPVAKDDEGRRLMLKMCKPRKPRKNEPQDAIIWHEDPADLARLVAYCEQDVRVEREVDKTLLQLTPSERELWTLDQIINDRGVYLDLPAVENLLALSDREKARLTKEIRTLTGGRASSASATDALRGWLAENGCPLDDLKKGTVERALAGNISGQSIYENLYANAGGLWCAVDELHQRGLWAEKARDVRRALEIRKEATKASTAKLKAMQRGAKSNARACGLLEFHGAGTGRWAGRRIQTQNMPRTPKNFKVDDAENVFSWAAIDRGEIGIRAEYGSALDGVSWSLRSLIAAAPGNELLCADYSNIEGRVLAWLAGETWKTEFFADYDRQIRAGGKPYDNYQLAYSKSFGVLVELVTEWMRQIGKVQELALGYQGGHGAFLSMGANYGIDLDAIAAAVRDAVDAETWDFAVKRYWEGAFEEAEEFLSDARVSAMNGDETDEDDAPAGQPLSVSELAAMFAKRNKFDLSPDVWAAIRIIVDGWRAAHPAVVQFWRDLERAAVDAVLNPGTIAVAGPIKYRKSGDFLYCRLPSGRALSYPYARIVREPDKWKPDVKRPKVIFEGIDGKTKRWCTQKLYGGLSAENVTQATARDILADAIKRLERAGLPVVMHVHDEIISEIPAEIAPARYEEFLRLMADKEQWADGLPVAVAGWRGERYRK